ncbi:MULTISPECIES: TIGR02587 family membrane protein [unclassified Leptolyngbya]|uniref:TIGR02587 family membrane protein n=1 Tax=unclassified Leptolyngbya TaxID=2650499 RepID=UPI00168750F4|nr:TIGR02587 family membrane protein [Leptolyngbya sp. FACHB-8]MBD2156813.1 TIGR02587 family membrane protein [Leptolyngbya sp. FACHB-16]
MPIAIARRRRRQAWKAEAEDLVRGACGGFLFGIPLLYTMEMWWIGSFVSPPMILGALVVTYIVVFLLNRTEGFRHVQGNGSRQAAIDSVEAIALGLLCTALILVLLQEITLRTPMDEALGKLVYESLPFTLGIALANQFLRGDRNTESNSNTPASTAQPSGELYATFSDIGATLIGSTIIAFNIAPTDEVPMLAAAIPIPWLLGIIVISLLISYGIVFEAGFAKQQQRMQQKGIFQRPLGETIAAYLISLAAAAVMLWFFQQLQFSDPWSVWLRYTLVLGLPATIGGAAGRLAI